jgi:hypothetical protein
MVPTKSRPNQRGSFSSPWLNFGMSKQHLANALVFVPCCVSERRPAVFVFHIDIDIRL